VGPGPRRWNRADRLLKALSTLDCNRATSTHRAQRQRPNCAPEYASREGKRLRWSRVWTWPIPEHVYVPPEAIEEYLAEEKRGVRVSS
jgi:hypothetical protein